MSVLTPELESGDEKIRSPAQCCLTKSGQKADGKEGGIKSDEKCAKSVFGHGQEKLEASIACTQLFSKVDVHGLNKNSSNITKLSASNKETDVISGKAVALVRRDKIARIPKSAGRKSNTTTSAKVGKIGLGKRKPRDNPSTGSSKFIKPSAIAVDRLTTSRFPKVSAPHPFQLRASTVGPSGCGGPARPLQTALPPIQPIDGAVGGGTGRGHSRIPVRACSAGCRAGHQVTRRSGRRSARTSSCGSDGGRQAERRSGRRSARSSSCGSDGSRQAALSPPPAASNWSLIDVNDNARLLLEGQTVTVLEHEFHAQPKTDLIVFEQRLTCSSGENQKNTPRLPHVRKLRNQDESAAGWRSAMTRSITPRSPRPGAAVNSSPTGAQSAASVSQQRRDSGPVSEAASGLQQRRDSGPESEAASGSQQRRDSGPASEAASRFQQRRDSGPVSENAGLRTQRRASDRCSSPGLSEASRSPSRVPGSSRSPSREPGTSHSPSRVSGASHSPSRVSGASHSPSRVPGAGRRPLVEYRPNLTPLSRQYMLLGLLGPDPDRVKYRQDKMRRRWEYVERLARMNRAAAQRRMVVSLRVCSAGTRSAAHSLDPQSTQKSTVPRSASAECVANIDSAGEPPPPARQARRNSITKKSKPSYNQSNRQRHNPKDPCAVDSGNDSGTKRGSVLPGERRLMVGGSSEPCTPAGHDALGLTGGCSVHDSADSDLECESASSLDWGPEQTRLSAGGSQALTREDGKIEAVGEAVEEAAAELEAPSFATAAPGADETVPTRAVQLESPATAAPGTIHQAVTSNDEQDTPRAETRTVDSARPCPETQPGLRDLTATESEGSVTATWTAEPVQVRPGPAGRGPAWAGLYRSLTKSLLSASEESEQTELLSRPSTASGKVRTPPADRHSRSDAAILPRHLSVPESDTGTDTDSDSDYDSDSGTGSDSDAEMVDAQAELSVATLHLDSPLPPAALPADCPDGLLEGCPGGDEGGGGELLARRSSSDDVFLELRDQLSVRVTAGRCRGAAGGCSCGLLARQPAPVSRATAPVSRATAPVSRATAPVSRATAPVSSAMPPVSRATAPVTAPVSRVTAPVSRVTAPVSRATAPVRRATPSVSRATQAPRGASFVYNNLLVMDLGSDGEAVEAAAAGPEGSGEAGAGTEPGRRRRWRPLLWPAPVTDDPATLRRRVATCWSDETLSPAEEPHGDRRYSSRPATARL